jgi:diaminopimelate decarboxylase
MASTYNSRSLIPEILISGEKSAAIRPRLTIEQQLAWENIPNWL